jgi:drug/metabolite transporter (DMT)-like permease
MKSFAAMAISVLIWSLYPLAATIGLKTMSSFQLIMIVYFISAASAMLVTGGYLFITNKFGTAWHLLQNISINGWIAIVISGIAGVLSHAFFIIALGMANKSGISLLYESWPIIAVIATPLMMKKAWKEVSFKEFLVGLIALIGVAIIILSDQNIQIKNPFSTESAKNINYTAVGGYILAFAAAYLTAILVVTRGVFAENFKVMHDDFASSFISETFSRAISVILVIFSLFYFQEEILLSQTYWPSAIFIGFVVFVVGGALYTYSLINADSPTIHIFYYFVPVFAVLWLCLARESQINLGLFIGAFIVVACNIYLFYASRKATFTKET